jgi:hypothetical protein
LEYVEPEVWKDIEDFEGYYQVSNKGRVRSLHGDEPYILKQSIKQKYGGYWYVNMSVDGNQKSCEVHRLMAIAFIPNPDNKPCVNHIDGNSLNNELSNLEWCTYAENNEHAYRLGLNDKSKFGKHGNHARGENHGRAKLSKNQVLQIRSIYEQGFESIRGLSKAYAVSKTTIERILNRDNWSHI